MVEAKEELEKILSPPGTLRVQLPLQLGFATLELCSLTVNFVTRE